MTNRPRIGFADELDDLSTEDWANPAPKPAAPVERAAAAAGFTSRQAPEVVAQVPPHRPLRRRRTGRNAQFNIKARPETIAAFTRVADDRGWGLGETLEHAVALLEKAYPAET